MSNGIGARKERTGEELDGSVECEAENALESDLVRSIQGKQLLCVKEMNKKKKGQKKKKEKKITI